MCKRVYTALEKTQIFRWLKNLKDEKYRTKDVVLEFSSEQIKEMMEEVVGMDSHAFVVDVLSNCVMTTTILVAVTLATLPGFYSTIFP